MNRSSAQIPDELLLLQNRVAIQLHDYCGVYFLHQEDSIVYVGAAKSISARIAYHLRNKKCRFNLITAIAVPLPLLGHVERYWIDQLKPKYNCILGRRPVLNFRHDPITQLHSKTKNFSFTAPKEFAPEIDRLAQRCGRSRSSLITWLVRQDIERENKK